MLRSVLSIASITLIAGTLLAPAAGAAVLGPATGVTATRSGNEVDVTFTPALATSRLKAGSTIDIECYIKHGGPGLLLDDSVREDGSKDLTWADGKVGAGGSAHLRLYGNTSDNEPGVADYCEVNRVRHVAAHSSIDYLVARIGLTPAGATYVDESERAVALRHLLQKAHGPAGYQAVSALGAGVVAIDAPDATPPAGQTGYWTDGTHAAVATLSAAGRRLLIEDAGDHVLRTNVVDQMDPLGLEDVDPTQVPVSTSKSAESPDADAKPSPYKSENPLTGADGVRAAVSGRHATMRFTGRSARTLRALRGRRVAVFCEVAPPLVLFPSLSAQAQRPGEVGLGVARVGRGGSVSVTLKYGTGDVCFVSDDGRTVAMAGGTAAGRAWAQDLAAVVPMLGAGDVGFAAAGGRSYLPTAKIVAAGRKQGYVAMNGPDGAVPVGKVGVWTDGARQAAIAVVSATGHRFTSVDEGNDGVGRSNLLSIYSPLFLSATFNLLGVS